MRKLNTPWIFQTCAQPEPILCGFTRVAIIANSTAKFTLFWTHQTPQKVRTDSIHSSRTVISPGRTDSLPVSPSTHYKRSWEPFKPCSLTLLPEAASSMEMLTSAHPMLSLHVDSSHRRLQMCWLQYTNQGHSPMCLVNQLVWPEKRRKYGQSKYDPCLTEAGWVE